jgi:hypothetical protein
MSLSSKGKSERPSTLVIVPPLTTARSNTRPSFKTMEHIQLPIARFGLTSEELTPSRRKLQH